MARALLPDSVIQRCIVKPCQGALFSGSGAVGRLDSAALKIEMKDFPLYFLFLWKELERTRSLPTNAALQHLIELPPARVLRSSHNHICLLHAKVSMHYCFSFKQHCDKKDASYIHIKMNNNECESPCYFTLAWVACIANTATAIHFCAVEVPIWVACLWCVHLTLRCKELST